MIDIANWNWSGIIQSCAALGAFIIAWVALNSWQKQQNANHVTYFIDDLTNKVHELLQSISKPISRMEVMNIEISSYLTRSEEVGNSDYEAITKFLEEKGEDYGKNLFDDLKDSKKNIAELNSLIVKGQIFSIDDYSIIQNNCEGIINLIRGIEGIALLVSLTNLHWANSKVRERIMPLLNINIQNIQNEFERYQKDYLTKAKEIYTKNYHTTTL